MKSVDMSPEAVSGRLRRVDELRDLCRTLAASRPMDGEKPPTSQDVRTLVKETRSNYKVRS